MELYLKLTNNEVIGCSVRDGVFVGQIYKQVLTDGFTGGELIMEDHKEFSTISLILFEEFLAIMSTNHGEAKDIMHDQIAMIIAGLKEIGASRVTTKQSNK